MRDIEDTIVQLRETSRQASDAMDKAQELMEQAGEPLREIGIDPETADRILESDHMPAVLRDLGQEEISLIPDELEKAKREASRKVQAGSSGKRKKTRMHRNV